MKISSRYNPKSVEDKWYNHWLAKEYFQSTPDERIPYTIVIPPPNVTGVLHMGHMLNNTVQDVLIRKARLDGKNTCWVPGMDHASIATEAKVVHWLRDQKGLKKSDVGREKFVEYAWEWTHKYGGIILNQLKRLGASCDWSREAFTMDDVRSKQVIRVFIDLYKKDKLYRDWRMVNWDPQAKTVLSTEEVIYREEQTSLHHVRYQIAGSTNEWITIATTRPETILGDTAIAVHPDDERYQHLRDKQAIVPLIGRTIPIISDDYVDQLFGSGALKVTPAHDVNDYEIGKRHNLEVVDILTDDGRMSPAAKHFVGDDLLSARRKMVAYLKEQDQLVKLEPYTHSVGRSERTDAIVEPKLSLQWYVKMKPLAEPALAAVLSDEVQFFPRNMKNTYRHWMENIRDWCISRQLWWGHRIPAYYYEDKIFVAETVEEALKEARSFFNNPDLTMEDLRQDEDVLDTWFSSWLWPFSVFDGMDPNDEVDYYYPTSVLVTGWDIIYLWVARMIMSGYEWKGARPFEHVYFTGMVRDKQRRKMSKSLGNSPDALKLIDDFGADGVRFGMLSCSPAGGDLLFDEKLCEQGRNFCNKIWNAMRLLKGWEESIDRDLSPSAAEAVAIDWFHHKTQQVVEQVEKDFRNYRLSDALMNLYSFIWNDFCSWYLEMIKPRGSDPLSHKTYSITITYLEKLMTLLHPFMPFITEEVWHQLKERNDQDCVVSSYPVAEAYDVDQIQRIDYLQDVISKVRDIRNKKGLKMHDELALMVLEGGSAERIMTDEGISNLARKVATLNEVRTIPEAPETGNVLSFVVGVDKFYIPLEREIDADEERATFQKELSYQRGFVESIKKKLGNARFVDNAPAAVVEKERQKLADGEKRIDMLEESLKRLES